MTPIEIKRGTLRVLRIARSVLMSAEYYEALKARPAAERKAAIKLLFQVDQAIVELGNAQLADIRDKLNANEDKLASATEEMEDAVEDLATLAKMFNAIGKVLGLVGRVVPLLA